MLIDGVYKSSESNRSDGFYFTYNGRAWWKYNRNIHQTLVLEDHGLLENGNELARQIAVVRKKTLTLVIPVELLR